MDLPLGFAQADTSAAIFDCKVKNADFADITHTCLFNVRAAPGSGTFGVQLHSSERKAGQGLDLADAQIGMNARHPRQAGDQIAVQALEGGGVFADHPQDII